MSTVLLWVITPAEVSNSLGFSESFREGGRQFHNLRSVNRAASSRNGRWKQREWKRRWSSCSLNADLKYACLGFVPEDSGNFPVVSSLIANPAGEIALTSEQKVYDVVLKQAALVKEQLRANGTLEVKQDRAVPGSLHLLNEAYDRCGEVCAEYAKTFYLG